MALNHCKCFYSLTSLSKIIVCGTVIIFLFQYSAFSQVNRVPDAYQSIKDLKCSKALKQVENEISTRQDKKIPVASVEYSKQKFDLRSSTYLKPPIPQRKVVITYFLEVPQEFISSEIFDKDSTTREYARRVISNCLAVATVAFWYYENGISWSITPRNNLVKDRCKSRGEALRDGMTWYEWICN